MSYADRAALAAYVVELRTVPADAEATRLLERASELIDDRTLGRAALLEAGVDDDALALVGKAACAQVEFWLEFGEDHGIVGLRGGIGIGALNVEQLPQELAPRARRHLRAAGVFSAMTEVAFT